MNGMRDIPYLSNFRLDAIVTQPVIARDKHHAEEKAKMAVSRENAEMDQISLVNSQRQQVICRVKDGVRLIWVGIRRTEHCLRFEAVFILKLSIMAGYSESGHVDAAGSRSYALRVSPIGNFPVLIIRFNDRLLLFKVENYVLEPVSLVYQFEGKPVVREMKKWKSETLRLGELNDASK